MKRKVIRRARRNYRRNIVSVPRRTTPDKVFVKLKYFLIPQIITTPSASDATYKLISGNNLNSPEFTTDQPTGYDQWSQFFTQFTVLASRVKIVCMSNATQVASSSLPVRVALLPSQESNIGSPGAITVAFTNQSALCMPHCRYKFTHNNADNGMKTLKGFMKTKTLFTNKDVVDDITMSGYTGAGGFSAAGPINEWFWYFNIYSPQTGGGAQTNGYIIWPEVTYYCMFSGPNVLNKS